jgi:outer membrane protein assembly factor BamB
MFKIYVSISCFLAWASLCFGADQVHWPDKHGPSLDGIVPEGSAQKVPVRWSENENVVWKTAYKGTGHSSPIILGDGVWFTSATEDGREQYVYCVDRKTGEVKHELTLYKNENPEELGNSINTYATPSCVAEPGAIYVHFGTYGTAKLNPETAEVIWERKDIKVRHFRGPASSPVLYKETLILTFDAIDQQFLTALDKHTGKTLWRTDRSVDFQDLVDGKPKRDGDFRKAFGTPGFAEVNGKTQILSVGSRAAYSYDADTGKEIWMMEHSHYNAAVRPTFVPEYNMAILNTGSGKAMLHGVQLDNTTKGKINDSHVKWSQRYASTYCMPVYDQGYLYQVTQTGKLSCTEIKTGETTWKESMRKSYMASPILFDGKILIIDDEGLATIFKATPDAYVQVSENKIAEGVSACPAVAEGELFLRANKYLYKISTQ